MQYLNQNKRVMAFRNREPPVGMNNVRSREPPGGTNNTGSGLKLQRFKRNGTLQRPTSPFSNQNNRSL